MRRRILPAAAAATLMLAGVTGCSAASSAADACGSPLQPGTLSSGVDVSGEAGEKPTADIPEDVTIQTSQRTVVQEADDRSRLAGDDTLLSVNLMLLDASSGEELMSSETFDADRGSSFVLLEEGGENPLAESLRCTAPGDRVVAAFSPEESELLAGPGQLSEGASIVGVLDVVNVDELRASGKKRNLPSGFPAVVTNEDGRPGVVLPPRPAPEGTQSASRIVGDGAEVQADDAVIANVLAVGWDGAVDPQNDSWNEEGMSYGPRPLGDESQMDASGTPYRAELTGKTVGSQVVIVEGGENSRVVVVDILSVG